MTSSTVALPTRAFVPQRWRSSLLMLVLLVGWILFLYREAAMGMVQIWSRSETFTHGFLVPPITLWLIWRVRHVLAPMTPKPSAGILLFVAVAAFFWLLGDLAAINAVTQLVLVTLLVLAVPAVLGMPVARQIIFPLAFLFFAVPIGEVFLPQLMQWTADFTVLALRLSGIPVFREGLQFVIPSGNWSVVEACSGVRYLIASFTVGTLFAYLNYRSTKRRVIFGIVSILVPVLANWLRAYMIVMLGHLSGNKIAVGVDHLIYGWVFFGIVIMMMFAIGIRWAEPDVSLEAASAIGAADKAEPVSRSFRTYPAWLVVTGFAVLVSLPQVAKWATKSPDASKTIAITAPGVLASDWRAVPGEVPVIKPLFQSPTAEINTTYVNSTASPNREVALYIAYYRHQDYDRKLVSSNNVLVASNSEQWLRVKNSSHEVALKGSPVSFRQTELRATGLLDQSKDVRRVAWQIYWINGKLTANEYVAKVYSAIYRLMGRGDDSAVIIVHTPKTKLDDPQVVLESFLTTNYSAINDLLLKMQASR